MVGGLTGTGVTGAVLGSDALDLLRPGALRPLRDVELDLLAFLELAVAAALDGRVVNEDVSAAAVLLDEAEALFAVEPLHGACCHWCCPLLVSEASRVETSSCRGSGRARHATFALGPVPPGPFCVYWEGNQTRR